MNGLTSKGIQDCSQIAKLARCLGRPNPYSERQINRLSYPRVQVLAMSDMLYGL